MDSHNLEQLNELRQALFSDRPAPQQPELTGEEQTALSIFRPDRHATRARFRAHVDNTKEH